jgi:hypothetical protein
MTTDDCRNIAITLIDPDPGTPAASYNGDSMPVNRFSIILIDFWLALPVLVFGVAWLEHYQHGLRTLLLPTLSAVLLLLAVVRNAKVLLLGSDYSHGLYVTIELNILLAVFAAVYFGVRKRWIAALAAVILALDWLYMGAVNSVV